VLLIIGLAQSGLNPARTCAALSQRGVVYERFLVSSLEEAILAQNPRTWHS